MVKRAELLPCPNCHKPPRWGRHYCACPLCGFGVSGTVDATHQQMGEAWNDDVIDYLVFLREYRKKKEEENGKQDN